MSEHALTLAGESRETRERLGLTETGLEGALFAMLDQENDRKMMSDVQDTLISMLQALAAENLRRWLTLIKDVLQASTGRCPLLSHLICSSGVYFAIYAAVFYCSDFVLLVCTLLMSRACRVEHAELAGRRPVRQGRR